MIAAGAVLALAPPIALWATGSTPVALAALAVGACSAAINVVAARHLRSGRALLAVATCAVGAIGWFSLLFCRVTRQWTRKVLQARIAVNFAYLAQRDVQVTAWRLNLPSLVWILDRPIQYVYDHDAGAEICSRIGKPGHFVVTDARYVADLAAWVERSPLDDTARQRLASLIAHPVAQCSGFNPGRGRISHLVTLGTLTRPQ